MKMLIAIMTLVISIASQAQSDISVSATVERSILCNYHEREQFINNLLEKLGLKLESMACLSELDGVEKPQDYQGYMTLTLSVSGSMSQMGKIELLPRNPEGYRKDTVASIELLVSQIAAQQNIGSQFHSSTENVRKIDPVNLFWLITSFGMTSDKLKVIDSYSYITGLEVDLTRDR